MATYEILPYSNAEFENSVRGRRDVGFSSMGSEKVAGRHVASRLGGPEHLIGLLEMDLSVASIEPTPFKIEIIHDEITKHLVPDNTVRNVDGTAWCVHVADKALQDPGNAWLVKVCTRAMEMHGIPLAIVGPKFVDSPMAAFTGYVDYRSRVKTVAPELGRDAADLINDSPNKTMSVRVLSQALVEAGWAERDLRLAEAVAYRRDNGVKDPEVDAMSGKVFRAMREGYLDFDPRSRQGGWDSAVHPRLTFLEERSVIRTLTRYMISDNKDAFHSLGNAAIEFVRAGPSSLENCADTAAVGRKM